VGPVTRCAACGWAGLIVAHATNATSTTAIAPAVSQNALESPSRAGGCASRAARAGGAGQTLTWPHRLQATVLPGG